MSALIAIEVQTVDGQTGARVAFFQILPRCRFRVRVFM